MLQNLFLYFECYTYIMDRIRSLFWYKRPVGTTQIHYTKLPVGTTGLIMTPQIPGVRCLPVNPRNTPECRATRHFSRKLGRVSFVRGALPKYKTCIYLSQTVQYNPNMSKTATWAHKQYSSYIATMNPTIFISYKSSNIFTLIQYIY